MPDFLNSVLPSFASRFHQLAQKTDVSAPPSAAPPTGEPPPAGSDLERRRQALYAEVDRLDEALQAEINRLRGQWLIRLIGLVVLGAALLLSTVLTLFNQQWVGGGLSVTGLIGLTVFGFNALQHLTEEQLRYRMRMGRYRPRIVVARTEEELVQIAQEIAIDLRLLQEPRLSLPPGGTG